MKIYNPYSYGNGTVIVSPGADYPNATDWIHGETKKPLQYTVKFRNNVAEVEDKMGEYLLEKGLAFRSPLFLPDVA